MWCIKKKYMDDYGKPAEKLFDPAHLSFDNKSDAYAAMLELADGDCDEFADSYDVSAVAIEHICDGTVNVAVKYCNKTIIISTYGIIEVPEPTAYRTPDNITAPSAAVASDMRRSASITHGNKLCTENE